MSAKISIVTVTYNCSNLIEKTLNSILNQTYPLKEIIIIDALSQDNTVNVIKKYSSQIDVFISEPDDGIFDAMNKGLRYATGEWLIFMNAGDSFVSDNVISDMSKLLHDECCDVVYGSHFLKCGNKIRLINDVPFFKQKRIYRNMGFSHQSCLVRTSLARKYPFNTDYKLCADYKMIWSLYFEEHARFVNFNQPIAIMDDNAGATISNYRQHLIEECNVCGFATSFKRNLFIEYKNIVFKIKRYIKELLFM